MTNEYIRIIICMHTLIVGKIITSEYVLRMAVDHYFYAQIKDVLYR